MPLIKRWLEYLGGQGIRYSHSVHHREETAIATAEAERMPAHALAKTVVYKGDTGFGLAVVAADELVDLEKVRRLLGLSHIRLAREEELARLFPDCELGAMPPFGDGSEMPVIVDTAMARDFIAFTIATHRDVVRIRFSDFALLANPKVATIALSEIYV